MVFRNDAVVDLSFGRTAVLSCGRSNASGVRRRTASIKTELSNTNEGASMVGPKESSCDTGRDPGFLRMFLLPESASCVN